VSVPQLKTWPAAAPSLPARPRAARVRRGGTRTSSLTTPPGVYLSLSDLCSPKGYLSLSDLCSPKDYLSLSDLCSPKDYLSLSDLFQSGRDDDDHDGGYGRETRGGVGRKGGVAAPTTAASMAATSSARETEAICEPSPGIGHGLRTKRGG
jgi:hypothetical protein